MIVQSGRYISRGVKVVLVTGGGSSSQGQTVTSVDTVNPDGTKTVVILSTIKDNGFVQPTTSNEMVWSGTVPPQNVVTWKLPKA